MQDPPPPLGSLMARATVSRAGEAGTQPVVSAAGTHASPGKNRVVLEKGHSQVDWMRLTRSAADLAGAWRGVQGATGCGAVHPALTPFLALVSPFQVSKASGLAS